MLSSMLPEIPGHVLTWYPLVSALSRDDTKAIGEHPSYEYYDPSLWLGKSWLPFLTPLCN